MPSLLSKNASTHRELATESIVVRIRWFGIAMGYVLALSRTGLRSAPAVCAILALGACYSLFDTIEHRRGRVFLKSWPLFVSLMESVFIALLCTFDTGAESPFRWYYLLSLVCCSIRDRRRVAWATFAFHSASYAALVLLTPADHAPWTDVALTLVILAWVTWASSSLAGLLRSTGERLEQANAALVRHRAELEARVAERTAALRASQAREMQKEKMSAFGLLSAGIAHEVGNPLAALSSLIQMLQRRRPDAYTAEKLDLAGRQLDRIRRTIRELVDFSRPASDAAGPVRPSEVVDEALGIAKYYHRTKGREITTELPDNLPRVWAVRDYLTQVILNLVINAIDATSRGGHIRISARVEGDRLLLDIDDNGRGIALADQAKLFEPHFTTKTNGTGLGLFVSRQIVEEASGELTFRSEPGRGTTFTVQLPTYDEGETPAAVDSAAAPASAPAVLARGELS